MFRFRDFSLYNMYYTDEQVVVVIIVIDHICGWKQQNVLHVDSLKFTLLSIVTIIRDIITVSY